jgi:multicomponent Na+:H+ antiporter subunit E
VTGRGALARAAVVRAAVLAAVWWAVAEGSAAGWGLMLVALAGATLTSLWLQPPGEAAVRLRALPRFGVWFLSRSVVGGADVARRALRRPVDVDPGEVDLPLRLPGGWPRVLLADAVSVLPGTLTARLTGDRIVLHVLDARAPVADEVVRLEREIALLFGLELPGVPPGPEG